MFSFQCTATRAVYIFFLFFFAPIFFVSCCLLLDYLDDKAVRERVPGCAPRYGPRTLSSFLYSERRAQRRQARLFLTNGLAGGVRRFMRSVLTVCTDFALPFFFPFFFFLCVVFVRWLVWVWSGLRGAIMTAVVDERWRSWPREGFVLFFCCPLSRSSERASERQRSKDWIWTDG